ncbi:hypothetical protein HN873_023961 [Arachis hypogaea]|nr:Cytochrome P450 [Arachis hypogaea]
MKFKDKKRFISLAKELAKVGTSFSLGDLFPSAKWLQLVSGLRPKIEKLHGKTDQILQSFINGHKEAKSSKSKEGQGEVKGLIDVLLRFEDGNRSNQDFSLTSNNIKAIILNIFGAGGGTTSTTIDWAMAEIMKDPTIMKKAQVEVRENFSKKGNVDETCLYKLKYLKSVLKETLRLHPLVPLFLLRECRSECDINGYHIPEKSVEIKMKLKVCLRNSNHHPRINQCTNLISFMKSCLGFSTKLDIISEYLLLTPQPSRS